MRSVLQGSNPFIDTDYFKFSYAANGDRPIDSQLPTSTLYKGAEKGRETLFGVNFADGRIKSYYSFACKGKCPKHIHLPTFDNEKKLILCEDIQMYYKHTELFMKFMRAQLSQQKAPANIMTWAKNILNS